MTIRIYGDLHVTSAPMITLPMIVIQSVNVEMEVVPTDVKEQEHACVTKVFVQHRTAITCGHLKFSLKKFKQQTI